MKSVVHDHINANPRRLQEKALFSKGVRFQQAVFECTDSVLIFLITAIKRSQVEVGRSVGDVLVVGVGAENIYLDQLPETHNKPGVITMDDHCCVSQQHAGDSRFTLLEALLLASQ